jgi:hypothetical protein
MANGRFDYNADGLLDLTYYRDGAWYVRFALTSGYGSEVATGNNEFDLMAGDPFGNGRDVLFGFNGTSTWYAFIWNGSSFSAVSTGIAYGSSSNVVSLADVDADGRDDFIYVKNSYYGEIEMATRPSTSTGSTLSFASEILTSYVPAPISAGWIFYGAYTAYVLPSQSDIGLLGDIDSNGDGRKEVMVSGGETMFCLDGDPEYCWSWEYSAVVRPYTDTESQYQYEAGFNSYAWPLYGPTHLNSDRCTDFVQFKSTPVLHSGCMSGFASSSADGDVRGALDWDGDGRQDLLVNTWYGTLFLQRSTGGGLASAVDTGLPDGCAGKTGADWYYCYI